LRQASDISLIMPFGSPIPPSPQASAAVLDAFAERDIAWCPDLLVTALDPQRQNVLLSDGSTKPYDLFLGIPVHRAPQVVLDSGMTQDGWIPVDPLTLETAYPGVYAVGDVTSVGTPKAGVFSEGQAAVAAARIIATIRGEPATATYDGRGVCYLEFGGGTVAKVDVTFAPGQRPTGDLEGPTTSLVADKSQFGVDRLQRWFASATP
jgi:sulfide:quinone oxidoreductase